MNLVVLELQQDKFFVELTSRDPEDVFQDHKDEKTNHIFTQKFKPTSFILESVEATKEDLETITFRWILENDFHTFNQGSARGRDGNPGRFFIPGWDRDPGQIPEIFMFVSRETR